MLFSLSPYHLTVSVPSRVIFLLLCRLCSGTEWASYNLGVFLCEACAQVHRSLGSHISKVKSLRLDKWDAAQIEVSDSTRWRHGIEVASLV